MKKSPTYYRRLFYVTSLVNGLSFHFIMGNLMILFLTRLQASDTSKGFISALAWFSFMCILLGKRMVEKIGIIKTRALMWISRSLAVLPIPLVCWLVKKELLSNYKAIFVIIVSQVFFQLFRGMGVAGNNPLFYNLTDSSNRARFLTMLQVSNNTGLILVIGISSALFLLVPNIFDAYAIFFLAGSLLGIAAGILYLPQQEPEPEIGHKKHEKIWSSFKILCSDKSHRNVIYLFLLYSLISSSLGGFLIVFMKENSSFSDAELVRYTLGGSISIVILGLLIAPLLDRVGAKPFIQIYSVLLLFVCSAMLIQAVIPSRFLAQLYILLFISNRLGIMGIDASLRAYFLNNVYIKGHTLNLGIIMQLIRGFGGLGLIFGGMMLDFMKFLSLSMFVKYNVFFGFYFILLVTALMLTYRLKDVKKDFKIIKNRGARAKG